ncbi:hypothetical protein M0804_008243 [Polistes exclamans]|nr:hypothetical protein M0804_008243 [Polistes exclamans]
MAIRKPRRSQTTGGSGVSGARSSVLRCRAVAAVAAAAARTRPAGFGQSKSSYTSHSGINRVRENANSVRLALLGCCLVPKMRRG